MTEKFEADVPDTPDTEDETLLDVLKGIRDSLENINDTLGSHPDMTWHTKASIESVIEDREILRNLFKKKSDK